MQVLPEYRRTLREECRAHIQKAQESYSRSFEKELNVDEDISSGTDNEQDDRMRCREKYAILVTNLTSSRVNKRDKRKEVKRRQQRISFSYNWNELFLKLNKQTFFYINS